MVNSKALTHTCVVWQIWNLYSKLAYSIQVRLHVVILRPKSTGQASRLEFQTGFLCSSPEENSFLFGKPQSLLLQPSVFQSLSALWRVICLSQSQQFKCHIQKILSQEHLDWCLIKQLESIYELNWHKTNHYSLWAKRNWFFLASISRLILWSPSGIQCLKHICPGILIPSVVVLVFS